MGYGQAVIGNRNTGGVRLPDPRHHLPPVPHTGATMDKQLEPADVLGIVAPGLDLDGQSPPHNLLQPPGDFYPPDIFARRVVGAGLGNQDAVTGTQPVNRRRAPHHLRQIPFGPGKQDRKSRHGDGGGHF